MVEPKHVAHLFQKQFVNAVLTLPLPLHFQDEQGWPDLKIQLIKELIEMSRELQNTSIPIR